MKWPTVCLGEVATIVGGSTPLRSREEFWNGDIPWVTPTDLPMPGEGIPAVTGATERITAEGLAACSAQLLPVGTVLFSSRATIGKVGISKVLLATNQGFANFIPKPWIDARFLGYSLQYHTPSIANLAGKTTFKEVSKGALRHYRILLPPLSEQRRIVEILDHADALRKKRAEADAKAIRIMHAIFIKIFGNPDDWTSNGNTKPLASLVEVNGGGTPSKQNPNFWEGEIPWVSPKDMKQDIIYDSADHISPFAVEQANLKYINPGTVLIVVRGMILSHTAPIALTGTRLTINQDIKALKTKGTDINPTYLYAALRVSDHKLLSQVRTAAHGTRKIDTEELLQLPIMIPSRQDLDRFHRMMGEYNEVVSRILKIGGMIERLSENLLHRAFSSDLTAKWREGRMRELLAEMKAQARYLESRGTNSQRENVVLQESLF